MTGLRFTNVPLSYPNDLTEVYIEFQSNGPGVQSMSIDIYLENTTQPDPYCVPYRLLAARPKFPTIVNWSPIPTWRTDYVYRTPNLVSLVNSFLNANRNQWDPQTSGLSFNFITKPQSGMQWWLGSGIKIAVMSQVFALFFFSGRISELLLIFGQILCISHPSFTFWYKYECPDTLAAPGLNNLFLSPF